MNRFAQRAEAIYEELSTKNVTPERVKQLSAEMDEIAIASKTHQAALGWSGSADPNPYGGPPAGYTGNAMPTMKAVGGLGKSQPKWQPPSPLHASTDELKQLFDAANHRAGGFQVELKAVGASSDVRTKAAGAPITETGGGFTLPSTIVPGLQMLLPYEPDRLFSHFPGMTMGGPSAAFSATHREHQSRGRRGRGSTQTGSWHAADRADREARQDRGPGLGVHGGAAGLRLICPMDPIGVESRAGKSRNRAGRVRQRHRPRHARDFKHVWAAHSRHG